MSPRLLGAVVLGGAVGACLRWGVGEIGGGTGSFPWTILAINVAGSALLALLPLLTSDEAWLAALGPGLLGGFTTMSAAAADTRALIDRGDPLLALVYCAGTVIAALGAVRLVRRWRPPPLIQGDDA